jgi:probable F420-dependent oxidoreductase
MRFGVHLPNIGPGADRRGLLEVARQAEQLGYDCVWTSDHIVVPQGIESRYPYNDSGDFPVAPGTGWIEAISALTFVAAVTERVRLGTSVLVLPYRNPVHTAKQLACLDVLSGGRLVLGAGAGWMREEFEALEMPFDKPGARCDEQIALMRTLWTEDRPSFEGRFYRYPGADFAPRPAQKPCPPILIGGHHEIALKRAGRLGDGWHAAFLEPGELGSHYQRVRQYATEAGRNPDDVILSARVRPGLTPEASAAQREAEVERLRAFGQAGASEVMVDCLGNPPDVMLRLHEFYARDILPKVSV